MARFTRLQVWHQSRELLRLVSFFTADMRGEGDLKSQIRCAAISVASNIAEGSERGGDREFHRFLSIANGSVAEVEAQATIAGDLGCLSPDQAQRIINQAQIVGRMLNRLMAMVADSG